MVIKIRRRFALVVFILLFLIFFKYNIDNNLSFLKIEKKINSSLINNSEENKNTVKLFCMIITQNKSLYNNRVIIFNFYLLISFLLRFKIFRPQ